MSQMHLPLYNPKDRGRLNALRSILAAVSDELRQQAPVAQGIVDFSVSQFPQILRRHTPFQLLSIAEPSAPESVSPYPFELMDFIESPTATRPEVFPGVANLIRMVDVTKLAEPLQQAELIGIDESQVDTPLPQSALAYLKSVAFRMYKLPDGSTDEAAGPILNEMRMQLREDEAFENENKLLSYIRNNFIAYISALTAIHYGRKPFVVLHGPLVRAIGGFSHLTFDYETAKNLFSLNSADMGEFDLPTGSGRSVIQGDEFTQQNMSYIPLEVADGKTNLRRFTAFCIRVCGRKCASAQVPIPAEAAPGQGDRITETKLKNRVYPGFCLYFWMLRSLYDLARLSETRISAVVENVAAATEMTRLILPSLVSNSSARHSIENSSLSTALRAIGVRRLPSQPNSRELYQNSRKIIDSLRLSDSNIFSYVLAEGQYTAPVQVYRYRTRNTFEKVLGYVWLGIRNELSSVLDHTLFPSQPFSGRSGDSHPGYRIMMSYIRTTPLREPIRLEYFDLPDTTIEDVAGPIYLLSLPYQEYGIPIILYYADKLARTPTRLVRAIIEREYLELVLQNRFSDPVSIMRILGRLSRGYFQREGLT